MRRLLIVDIPEEKRTEPASDIFKAGVDDNFERFGLGQGYECLHDTKVEVVESSEDLTFRELFPDPESQCVSVKQVKSFCLFHEGKLRREGFATFFLTKKRSYYYVMAVMVYGNGLGTAIFSYRNGKVWQGKNKHLLARRLSS